MLAKLQMTRREAKIRKFPVCLINFNYYWNRTVRDLVNSCPLHYSDISNNYCQILPDPSLELCSFRVLVTGRFNSKLRNNHSFKNFNKRKLVTVDLCSSFFDAKILHIIWNTYHIYHVSSRALLSTFV